MTTKNLDKIKTQSTFNQPIVSAPIKLSIITVNLNNAAGLSKTLESVASQTFTNYEHIIIDGGSTDGSVDIIKDYERKYNGAPGHLYWVSEPDKGIYNAMNKGIKVARGEYCLFLNSGDWLFKRHVLEQVKTHLSPPELIIYGNIITNSGVHKFPATLNNIYFLFSNISHPSTFIETNLIRANPYVESFKILSDYYFIIKSIIHLKVKYKWIDVDCTYFDTSGVSNTLLDIKEIEKVRILEELMPDTITYYTHINEIRSDLEFYRNSKIVQVAKKIQMYKNDLFRRKNI